LGAGVRGVQIAEASGSRIVFSVLTRGSAVALQASLAANPRLESVDPSAGGSIAFRYRP